MTNQGCKIESWCPGVPVACQKHVDQAAMQIQDLRDLAQRAFAARDEARAMLAAANEREQALIKKLDEVLKVILENLEEPPRPMCKATGKPDPLEDLMPPARNQGGDQ